MVALVIASDVFGILVLFVLIYFLGRPIIHGAIYFPTTPRGVREMLELAEVKLGQRIADLGSGDGRILIALAEKGATAIGYEINPVLVRQSRRAIERAGFGIESPDSERNGSAVVHWESFWDVDLGQFDTVIVYGIPYIMRDLKRKLERELRPGTKIISNAFTVPGWKATVVERKIYLYIWEG
jgi:cyclopropane fatty-acyl-phospholipid synthase-like methyltransferase